MDNIELISSRYAASKISKGDTVSRQDFAECTFGVMKLSVASENPWELMKTSLQILFRGLKWTM
jgi:hypothetical protein